MIYKFANCFLDTQRRELTVDGAPVHVEPQVFDVLRHLIENRDRVVSRDELIDTVWRGRIVSEATISARIFAARHAVGDSGGAQAIIRTVPRRGFRFVATLNMIESSEDETAGLLEEQVSLRARDLGKGGFFAWPAGTNRWRWILAAAPITLLLLIVAAWWMAQTHIAGGQGGFPLGTGRSIAVIPFDSFGNEEDQRFLRRASRQTSLRNCPAMPI